jgi:rhodanese-related sulfurtransferase
MKAQLRRGNAMVKKHLIGFLGVAVICTFALGAQAGEKTVDQLLEEARSLIISVPIGDVKKMVEHKEKVIVLDVRDMRQHLEGHIPGAINLPRAVNVSNRLLEHHITKLIPDKNAKVLVYCAVDLRSPLAVKAMNEIGYKNAVHMIGGYKAWQDAGYPVEK